MYIDEHISSNGIANSSKGADKDKSNQQIQRSSKALVIESKHTFKLTHEWREPSIKASNDVKIRIVAAGLNAIDYKSVDYNFNLPEFPWTLGREASGVVVELGENASQKFKVGDKVWTSTYYRYIDGGVFQDYVVVPSHTVVNIPSHLTFDKAASLGVTALTSSMTLHYWLGIPINNSNHNPESLLVWGASTVTGQFVIQLAIKAGLKVYGIASDQNVQLVESLGAIPISRTGKTIIEIVEEVEIISNKSIKYVVDLIGNETSIASFRLLHNGGSVAPLASTTFGKEVNIPTNINVHFIEMKRFILDVTYRWHADYINSLIEDNFLRFPSIDIINGLENVENGLKVLKKGNMNGRKLVVLL